MEDQIVDLIQKLSQAVEKASMVVWENAVEQAFITGIWYVLVCIFWGLLGLCMTYIVRRLQIKLNRRDYKGDGSDVAAVLVLTFVVGAISFLIVIINLHSALTYTLNPEWGAILILKELAGL